MSGNMFATPFPGVQKFKLLGLSLFQRLQYQRVLKYHPVVTQFVPKKLKVVDVCMHIANIAK